MRPPRKRQLAAAADPTGAPAARPPLNVERPLDGYVRVSRVRGRSGEHFISPDVQEEQIRAYARARGRTIGTVFCELDRSGMTFKRALLQQALRRIESGESGGLIVARLDRFARTSLEALEAIGRIDRVGGDFVSVEDGLDSSTPFGRAMMTVLLALAELEVGRAKENWRLAQAHAVLRGIHVTGRLPLGYRRDPTGRLTPLPGQAAALHDAFVDRAFGALPGEIVTSLRGAAAFDDDDEREHITLRSVNYLLRNPVYTGEARCGDCINPTGHPAIVSRALWLAAQNPPTRTILTWNADALLAGLVRCGSCGGRATRRRPEPLARKPGAERGHVYRCRNRGAGCPDPVVVDGARLEDVVVKRFFRWLASFEPTAAEERIVAADRRAVEADAAYGRAVAAGRPGPETAAAKLASERAWLDLSLLAPLALAAELPNADTLRSRWSTLTVRQRRQLLAASITSVTVGPTDAASVTPIRVAFVGRAPRG